MTDAAPSPTGLLLIDKQPGFTSMDVCAIIRTRLRRAGAPKRVKVGHGGTLDPLATGLLVVLIGKATRLCDVIMVGEKTYEARVDLAHRSATDDAEGERTPVEVAHIPSRDEVDRVIATFIGVIQQKPPAFSAVHVGGRRAYDLARRGQAVDPPARSVTIHAIRVVGYAWPFLDIEVVSGKGVYIRSLARDIGAALGAGGMLASLRRTRTAQFDVRDARSLDQLPQALTQAELLPLPPEHAPPSA